MFTKREMDTKVCSKCREVKLFSEFNKRKAKKDGYRSECKACKKEYQVEYYAANSEKRKEYQVEYYAANPEKIKERHAECYAANPEKGRTKSAEYRAANPDYHAEYYAAHPEKIKATQTQYYLAKPEKFRAKESNRRAAKSKAIPKWLTKEDWQSMEDIGKEAKRLTKETGIKYEVDHIHPLRGKLICGLQCPSNLQILTMTENRSKGNKFIPYVESA